MINPTPVDSRNTPYSSPSTPRPNLPRTLSPAPHKHKPKRTRRIIFLVCLSLLAAGVTYGYAYLKSLQNSIIIEHEGEASSVLSLDPNDPKNINASQFKKMGDGRFNVAVVGIGGAGHPGGQLTDSIQVLSMDTITKKVSLTSIPRDLYVTIPGQGQAKINTVYQAAESKKAGSGALQVRQVIGSVLGTNISNFILLDFSGAVQLIDNMGGIDVVVPTAINDPYFPDDSTTGYSPFSIAAGPQHMNGKTALRYARSRETTSDFDRSARQQLIIAAIKKKALSAGTLANPAKVTSMMGVLGQHIKTDMSADQIRAFVAIYRDIPADGSSNYVLDTSEKLGLLTSSSSTGAGYISYPRLGQNNFSDIQEWFHKNNPDPLLKREAPTVSVVASGSTTTKQLQDFVDTLNGYGYTASISSATINKSSYTTTAIFDTTNKKPISRNYLSSYLNVTAKQSSPLKSGSDFEIVYVAGSKK